MNQSWRLHSFCIHRFAWNLGSASIQPFTRFKLCAHMRHIYVQVFCLCIQRQLKKRNEERGFNHLWLIWTCRCLGKEITILFVPTLLWPRSIKQISYKTRPFCTKTRASSACSITLSLIQYSVHSVCCLYLVAWFTLPALFGAGMGPIS